jgi:uncharacterized protein YjbI with pentapeptide repeats
MAKPWIGRICRIAVAVVVIVAAVLVLLQAIAVLWEPQWWPDLSNPRILAIAVIVLVPLVAVLAAIWWLWWQLPRRQVRRLDIQIHDPKARADAEDNFRKTVGQALGGAAVLIGAVVAYLQFTQQQQGARDQLQASHDLLISNQVSKGFEQLAGDKTAMRLGGVYALEGVMNTAPEYHRSVLEALCAFVRDSTKNETGKDSPASDVQAALTVIGRRKTDTGNSGTPDIVDLERVRIPKVILEEANLNRALLTGANSTEADLFGANLNFARLVDANLSGAYLWTATLISANLTQT